MIPLPGCADASEKGKGRGKPKRHVAVIIVSVLAAALISIIIGTFACAALMYMPWRISAHTVMRNATGLKLRGTTEYI